MSVEKLSSLRQHQKCHRGEKPCKYNECVKTFLWKSHLWKHQSTHHRRETLWNWTCVFSCHISKDIREFMQGEKPVKVWILGNSFFGNQPSCQRLHTGRNAANVTDAAKVLFPTKLSKLNLWHNSDGSVVIYTFSNESHLRKHQKTHKGEKFYERVNMGKSS